MEREYTCVDCGATFVLDTKMRCGAKRCPECAKIRTRYINNESKKRQIQRELKKMFNSNRNRI